MSVTGAPSKSVKATKSVWSWADATWLGLHGAPPTMRASASSAPVSGRRRAVGVNISRASSWAVTGVNRDSHLAGPDNVDTNTNTTSTPDLFHSKTRGSNLGNDKTYVQKTFAPGSIGKRVKKFRFLTQMYARFWNDLADHASA